MIAIVFSYAIRPSTTIWTGSCVYYRASVPEAGEHLEQSSLKQYHVDKTFADRRYKVQSARTYFYLNEATCERNMETFLQCLEAVAGGSPRNRSLFFNFLLF